MQPEFNLRNILYCRVGSFCLPSCLKSLGFVLESQSFYILKAKHYCFIMFYLMFMGINSNIKLFSQNPENLCVISWKSITDLLTNCKCHYLSCTLTNNCFPLQTLKKYDTWNICNKTFQSNLVTEKGARKIFFFLLRNLSLFFYFQVLYKVMASWQFLYYAKPYGAVIVVIILVFFFHFIKAITNELQN